MIENKFDEHELKLLAAWDEALPKPSDDDELIARIVAGASSDAPKPANDQGAGRAASGRFSRAALAIAGIAFVAVAATTVWLCCRVRTLEGQQRDQRDRIVQSLARRDTEAALLSSVRESITASEQDASRCRQQLEDVDASAKELTRRVDELVSDVRRLKGRTSSSKHDRAVAGTASDSRAKLLKGTEPMLPLSKINVAFEVTPVSNDAVRNLGAAWLWAPSTLQPDQHFVAVRSAKITAGIGTPLVWAPDALRVRGPVATLSAGFGGPVVWTSDSLGAPQPLTITIDENAMRECHAPGGADADKADMCRAVDILLRHNLTIDVGAAVPVPEGTKR